MKQIIISILLLTQLSLKAQNYTYKGLLGAGSFLYPSGIAIDNNGNIYVVDAENYRIQKFNNNGKFVLKWGSKGNAIGQFDSPYRIAIDGSANIYVSNINSGRIQKFDSSGKFLKQWGTVGTKTGQFNGLRGIACSENGYVYAVDNGNNRIQVFDTSGIYLRNWGGYGTGSNQFISPFGISVDKSGSIYITNDSPVSIKKFSDKTPIVWSNNFSLLRGICVDKMGHIYVTDAGNLNIVMLDTLGNFITSWGSGGTGNGKFNSTFGPNDVAIGVNGDVYVVDTGNNRIQIFSSNTTTALTDNLISNDKMIYTPNPSNGIFKSKYSKGQIRVSNTIGTTIYQGSMLEYMDLSNQGSGVYIVEYNSENGFSKQKLIVE